jgi:hypothetical protein
VALQSAFDLLAEIVRCDTITWTHMIHLLTPYHRFQKFMQLVLDKLVRLCEESCPKKNQLYPPHWLDASRILRLVGVERVYSRGYANDEDVSGSRHNCCSLSFHSALYEHRLPGLSIIMSYKCP